MEMRIGMRMGTWTWTWTGTGRERGRDGNGDGTGTGTRTETGTWMGTGTGTGAGMWEKDGIERKQAKMFYLDSKYRGLDLLLFNSPFRRCIHIPFLYGYNPLPQHRQTPPTSPSCSSHLITPKLLYKLERS